MKTNRTTRTLAAMLLGTLGLMATGAQAGWGHSSYTHTQAYQQNRWFSQQVDARQTRQIERIRHGMQTGQLTRREFHELMQDQDRIRAMERHFRADGRLDAREFERLDRALELASRQIRVQMHDRQARAPNGPAGRYN